MVAILALWLPIVVAAIFVFIVSSIIHMFLTYHQNDFAKVPDEDNLMDAIRPFNIPPGDYVLPCAGSVEVMKSEAFQEKANKGPVIFMTVLPTGPLTMKKSLILWFVYCLVIGVFVAYITGRALGPEAHYLEVFRFAGCTAFLGYAGALWQNSIWSKKKWSTTIKSSFDGLIYGLVTAGVFGWLWPGV